MKEKIGTLLPIVGDCEWKDEIIPKEYRKGYVSGLKDSLRQLLRDIDGRDVPIYVSNAIDHAFSKIESPFEESGHD